jgi:hypothetical protein
MRALLVTALLVVGCSKSNHADVGPACGDVVDHMLAVMKAGLTGHDTVALGNRDQMIAQCEQRKMSATERRCLLNAKAIADLAACHPKAK